MSTSRPARSYSRQTTPENYIVAFEAWAQQAPADVKQKSDANRAAAKDTRWSEVVTLPSPDNPV